MVWWYISLGLMLFHQTVAMAEEMDPIAKMPQPIYIWSDAQGVVHFSDKAHPGARVWEHSQGGGRMSSVVESPAPKTQEPLSAPDAELKSPYSVLSLESPLPEQTLHSASTEVFIHLTPALKPGHELRLVLDGQTVAVGDAVRYRLQEIDRGAHQLRVEVWAQEQRIQQSEPVTFYRFQPSRLKPTRVAP